MKSVRFDLNGEAAEMKVARVGESIWIHFQGETYSFPIQAAKKNRKGKSTEAESGDTVAPMPGKVTQVLAKVGQKVAKGDTLIVMEAMKMEYNLKAPAALEVLGVDVTVGQQVQLGHVLVLGKLLAGEK